MIEANHPALVLEIASGFGDHILAYAREYPKVSFQPTEYDEYLVGELSKKIEDAGLSNVLMPKKLDVTDSELSYGGNMTRYILTDSPFPVTDKDWHIISQRTSAPFDIITVTNLVNVAPWWVYLSICIGLRKPTR